MPIPRLQDHAAPHAADTKKKRRRTKWLHPGAARLRTAQHDEVWTVDFKGQFRTQDGVYCYPLTVLDNCTAVCRIPSVATTASPSPPPASMACASSTSGG
jgi:hypothetical protein